MRQNGGQILAAQLVAHGVDRVFTVPGESFLPLLDALRDAPIRTVVARHETGAGMMAEADAKLTGRPGVVCVTRGPGAGNVAHAVHIAQQDSTPLVVLVGQVMRAFRGRGASQEVECGAMFGYAKMVAEVEAPEQIPGVVAEAFRVALSGRLGPVVLSLPEDMLFEAAEVAEAVPLNVEEPELAADAPTRLAELLEAAERPVAILGGSGWSADAVDAVERFAEAWELPVICSFRRQMLFDAMHANYVGELGYRPNPDLVALVKSADLVLLVGGRLNDVPSQDYTLLEGSKGRLVHVHPDGGEFGRAYHPDLSLEMTPAAFARLAEGMRPARKRPPSDRVRSAHESYMAWSGAVPALPGRLQMGEVMRYLRETLPPDAIICNGAGNYATWAQRFYRFRRYGTQLAPVSGSMGYGVPAAVAAKLRHPERIAVAFAGDGCFLMNGQEMAVAVQEGAAIIVVVIDNAMYGSIRMHQERSFPGREHATALRSPDFAALARAYGAEAETIRDADEFAAAFGRAREAEGPVLLHCHLDPEAITAGATLTQIQERALRDRQETEGTDA